MLAERTLIGQTVNRVDQKVTLYGWVNSIRDHGKLVFLDLRDRSGLIQVVGNKELLGKVKNGFVLAIEGKVKSRPQRLVNDKIATGGIELLVEKVTVLAKSQEPPLDVSGLGKKINDDLRLRYRYLDLRRPRLRKNLEFRHRLMQAVRQSLSARGFWEIDTPNLSKSTPEGARDFLVPSRLHQGKFYALPQSPQQYKQLLMVAGVEKYFQIATCFRDEDLRADRGLEFKQIDIEMSFVTRDEILALVEEFVVEVVETVLGRKISSKPFPKIAYQEAKKRYKTDKPDLRKNPDDPGELAFAWIVDFPLFEKTTTREINPMHHPFTSPNPDDLPKLAIDPLAVRSWQYDLVLNGQEIAGGSVRITDPKVQKQIFKILGHKDREIQERFGHLLEAFSYGVPPHGGIAFGFDRLAAILLGEDSIREVIAFPVNASGRTSVMEAPSRVDQGQLKELGLKTVDEDPDQTA
ncbi:MAG: aspartate--tRNA ligase [Candidatus Shapirobacteria bacterium]|nr:aspartate--tRNA ligase [Candidatus Shapirobacteria bacterium]MDD5481925.1 aspartate--tRNA ligase [Candidatus Shapirobacteria bacterium]